MSNDLRGQLSEVGPPAEGVVGDLPVAKNSKRPMMLVVLVVVIGGYAIYAGRTTAPDPAQLGVRASIDQPVAVVPPTVATPAPQVMNQPAIPPIQVAPGSAQITSSAGDASAAGRSETPITAAKTKAAPKAAVRTVSVVVRVGTGRKPSAAQIDEIGITEE